MDYRGYGGGGPPPLHKKSLLIGINYTGSQNALQGCHQDVENIAEFLSYRGYSSDQRSQVILRDDRQGAYYPTGPNILAAIDWLISEPGSQNFLHYSGHGGQIQDDSGGFHDTIVPVDFERHGQISSDVLHQHLVSHLPPSSTLFVILDCCHSGSALELPYVYRSDEDGNVNLMDNLKMGVHLFEEAEDVIQGGFSFNRMGEAADLFAGAKDFFHGLRHQGEQHEAGLASDSHGSRWAQETKFVTMFSGCRDDQTSADANIGGIREGAMTWAFLECMKKNQRPSYMQTLTEARFALQESQYTQVPQLSVGVQFDLNDQLRI